MSGIMIKSQANNTTKKKMKRKMDLKNHGFNLASDAATLYIPHTHTHTRNKARQMSHSASH